LSQKSSGSRPELGESSGENFRPRHVGEKRRAARRNRYPRWGWTSKGKFEVRRGRELAMRLPLAEPRTVWYVAEV